MWLIFFVVVVLANREADRAFFKENDLRMEPTVYQSYIPATPMASGDFVKSFYERIFPMVNTKFRFTMNPARCEKQHEHQWVWSKKKKSFRITIGLLDDHLPENRVDVSNMKSHMTFRGNWVPPVINDVLWHRFFEYNCTRVVDGLPYPSPLSSLRVRVTMNDAYFYVEIKGRFLHLYLFEEDSRNVKLYQVISTKKRARFFLIMANELDSCPTFISMVDKTFPFWVPGMPLNKTVNGTALPDWRGRGPPVFDIVLYASMAVAVYCAVAYLIAIPLYINKNYPNKFTEVGNEENVHVFNLGLMTEELADLSDEQLSKSPRSSRDLMIKVGKKESSKVSSISRKTRKNIPSTKKKSIIDLHKTPMKKKTKVFTNKSLRTQESEAKMLLLDDLNEDTTQQEPVKSGWTKMKKSIR